MNNTITSFSYINKFKTIPIFNQIRNQSTDEKYSYNSSNHLNQIESVKGTLYSNSYLQTDINSDTKHKRLNQQKNKAIPSIKHLSFKKKKNYCNNINILKFNKDMCSKTVTNNFIGKKIQLSKYPLISLNKISEYEGIKKNAKYFINNEGKESKTVEINSTFFENNNVGCYNMKRDEYFYLTKIEKELNALLNKTKQNKLENNVDNYKIHINSVFNHNNESKIKTENNFFKETKINKEKRGNILNIKINRKDLFNQYLNSNIVKRKVLFIDKYNNTVSNDNTITLLGDEKDLLLEKYLNNKDDKGNDVNLPLLQRYNKAIDKNGKFLTEFNDKNEKQNNTTNDQTKSSSLSKLIKDRFTKQNYKNQKISGTNQYEHYNPNLQDNENKKNETGNGFADFYKNKNQNVSNERRKNRTRTKTNALNDILGVIKAKSIGPKIKKKKKIIKSPKKDKDKDKEKNKKKKRKLERGLSQINIVSSVKRISRKFSMDYENHLKSLINVSITIKNERGKKIKVTLIKKKNKIIPINQKGHEIKNPKVLDNLYEEIKSKINSEKQKKLLPKKRASVNPTKVYINPFKIPSEDEQDEESDLSKSKIEGGDIKSDSIQESKTEKEDDEEKIDKIKIQNQIVKQRNSIMKEINTIPKNNDSSRKSIEINQKKEKMKNEDNTKAKEDSFYKEEDDFVKDFNFEFYSSEEETNSVSYQKLMRLVRKKINKYLFQIFEFIAKNSDLEKQFKKEDLIKFLIDKDFRNYFRLLKEQIVKLRELVRDSLDPEGKDKKKKIYIKDLEIINYIYRYITDKNSLFYKSIYKRIKTEQEEERKNSDPSSNYNKLFSILKKSMKEGSKKKNFSIYSKRNKEYSEDKPIHQRANSKKFVKKKKVQKDLEFISQDEKKMLIMNEINLTNEIRYQISIANDKESREKFKNLLNKIESLRSLSGDEYVKSLKKNFTMFKDEAEEILKAKEIEERLNGFIDDLNYQRNNFKEKHKFIMSLMYIRDNKFLSSFENEAGE